MHQSKRLQTLIELGDYLRSPAAQPELQNVAERAHRQNNWFTPQHNLQALSNLATQFLAAGPLTAWAAQYPAEPAEPRLIGLVMAGNIPAVGFHDLLCVLVSGHRALVKLSSQDFVLIQYLIQKISDLNPELGQSVSVVERLNAADAFIATGSDNTARYFHHYFSSRPHIIRKNRTSLALLTGTETPDDFNRLGDDILTYYGLGCRNVSTLLVPENYRFDALLHTLEPRLSDMLNQHKYQNNYDYNKSIYLVNRVPHFDNGFLLLTENDALVSPISVVYYQTYRTPAEAGELLRSRADKIQVVTTADGQLPASAEAPVPVVAFGETQRPGLSDYADGVDTMAFLTSL